jgi:Bacterial membrane protein YfhO
LIVAQRALAEIDTFATFPAKSAYPRVALFEPLQSVKAPFRIVGTGLTLPPSANVFYDLEDPRGYEALTLEEFQRTWKLWSRTHEIWFNRVDGLTPPFLSFLNVRFALQPADAVIPEGWQSVREDRGTRLVENLRAADRVFVPRRVQATRATAVEIVDRMAPIGDFRDLALITTRAKTDAPVNGPGTIVLRDYSPGGEYRFEAGMQSAGWVVISECAWKGWRATIDGKRVPLHRANAAFLGVFVPAGRHSVHLRYLPGSFVLGRAISFATLGAIVVFALFRKRFSRDRVTGLRVQD